MRYKNVIVSAMSMYVQLIDKAVDFAKWIFK